jgi:predicted methyltransferase MtxX (methanogen marker protein 4)
VAAGRLAPLGRSKRFSRWAVDGEEQGGPLSDG